MLKTWIAGILYQLHNSLLAIKNHSPKIENIQDWLEGEGGGGDVIVLEVREIANRMVCNVIMIFAENFTSRGQSSIIHVWHGRDLLSYTILIKSSRVQLDWNNVCSIVCLSVTQRLRECFGLLLQLSWDRSQAMCVRLALTVLSCLKFPEILALHSHVKRMYFSFTLIAFESKQRWSTLYLFHQSMQ